MEINYNSWYKAIFNRYSVRNFNGNKLKKEDADKIQYVCDNFRPYTEVKAVFVNNLSEDVYKGIIGSYGKIKGAPAYIAFIGDMKDPHIYEKLGYTGEGVILEGTDLGLGTCWIAGTFSSAIVGRHTNLKENEKVLAITPIGYPSNKLTFDQKLLLKLTKKGRKTIEEIVDFNISEEWMKEAIDSARLAPSAMNLQPWKFAINTDDIVVKIDKPKPLKRLDCGIAMLHFQLGAFSKNVEGSWEFLESPYVGRFIMKKNKSS